MPGEAFTAGGAIAGALIGSGSQKRAAQAQERANREAFDYQKQRDAREDEARAAEAASARQWWEFQMDMRTAAAKRAGYDVPDWRSQFGLPQPGQSGKSGTAPASARLQPGQTAPAPVTGIPPGPGSVPASGSSLGDILGVGGGSGPMGASKLMDSQGGGEMPAENPIMGGGNTLGDIAGWSDWKRSLR